MSSKKSKKWRMYHIPERLLKWYKGMDYNDTRPVLVICDDSTLLGSKCLVVELSTHDDKNPHRIEWFKYYSQAQQKWLTNYIIPDKIHTVSRYYLTDNHQSHNNNTRTLSQETKDKIYNFIKSLLK